MSDNTVKFGLKNVHFAFITDDGYATPVHIPGAVNLTLDASGSESKFYADDIKYYGKTKNDGYSGTLELALFPDEIKAKCLGWYLDTDGGLVEDADGKSAKFALMYEISGDQQKRRFVDYECEITRPSVNAQTTEDSEDPQTDTVNITAYPRKFDSIGKNVVSKSVQQSDAAYNNFFNAVVLPKDEPGPPAPTPSIVLSTYSPTDYYQVGDNDLIKAIIQNADGAVPVWSSSDDSVLSVSGPYHGSAFPGWDGAMILVGEAPGTATITATITVDGVEYSDSLEFAVVPSISVSLDEYTITVGDTATATAASNPSGYTLTDVEFTSQYTDVATVDETTGAISGVGEGQTLIYAHATYTDADENEYAVSGFAGIMVEAAPAQTPSVEVSTKNDKVFYVYGANGTAYASVSNSDAVPVWTSSDDNVATIQPTSGVAGDNPGFITAVGVGSATLTATITVDGVSYSDSVNIKVGPSINVSLDNSTITVGDTATATATSNPSGYTLTNIVFSSANQGVATIDATTGVITGVGTGESRITATGTYTDGQDSYQTTTRNISTITVEAAQ